MSSCCCCCYSSGEDPDKEFYPIPIPPGEDPKNVTLVQKYVDDPNGSGLKFWTVDFREGSGSNDAHSSRRPDVPGGEMWTDPEFPLSVAIRESRDLGLHWKRPHEIVSDPVLFSEGASRNDIRQKYFGTCWFLSVLTNLAEKPELFSKVITESSWRPRDDGVCHCRLWRFGDWEDVYMDDCLPVYASQRRYRIYGAMSDTDSSEMWVSLLEKSLARLHGSYNTVSDQGGYPSDAYLTLTGGVPERLDLEKDGIDSNKLFRRISKALKSGALITCAVPKRNDKREGLVGGHAYSLTGAYTVVRRDDNQGIPILRVRNPYGAKEWNGKWSDGSAEWQRVTQGANLKTEHDDGEFWIGMEDFLKYFNQTTICALTPDFDMDGRSDRLMHVLKLYGEWRGSSAVGEGMTLRQRLRNPRFELTIPSDNRRGTDQMPIVVQLIQNSKHLDNDSIRCDLYKVYHGGDTARTLYLREQQDEEYKDYYYRNIQCCFRYWLEPGRYIMIPSTYKSGSKKDFLLRVYTPRPLEKCRKISPRVTLIPR